VNPFKHLFFIMRQRGAGNRVSFAAYLKGYERITLGSGCKIHADASVDASRSPGVRLGNKVTLNRYAYVQGGGDTLIGPGVPATVKNYRE
jgi:carbonic anhydrase/acetyltransferase-like protein (isoleucine patch superfamily)